MSNLIDRAGRLDKTIKTETATLKGLKEEIKEQFGPGVHVGEMYKDTISEFPAYEDIDPVVYKKMLAEFGFDEECFVESVKILTPKARAFLGEYRLSTLLVGKGTTVRHAFKKI